MIATSLRQCQLAVMGSKTSKNIDLSTIEPLVQTIPYTFLDTSNVTSSDTPNMIKILSRPCVLPDNNTEDGEFVQLLNNLNHSTSYLAFAANENSLLFGTIHVGDLNGDMCERLPRSDPAISCTLGDNLCLIHIQSGQIDQIINKSIRDISVFSSNNCVALLTYLGCTYVEVWQFNKTSSSLHCIHQHKQDELYPNRTAGVTCCSISPDQEWLVVAVSSNIYSQLDNYVKIFMIIKNKADKKLTLRYHKTLASFTGAIRVFRTMLVSLEFSSDSELLAVGSKQKVFVASSKMWSILTEICRRTDFSCSKWGIFYPQSTHNELITITEDGHLQVWDTTPLYNEEQNKQIHLTNLTEKVIIPEDEAWITSCPKFSPDGTMLAVTFQNGSVVILDANLFQKLWSISYPDFPSEFDLSRMSESIQATSVCFSKSCEYLAIAYCRDVVSLWLLPRVHFTLKHLCRTKIISMCSPSLVHELPIPDGLKQYLLYQI